MSESDIPAYKRFLTEGTLLATVPIVASFFAYLFEFGYVKHFDIPASFIQLDITRILTATAVIIFAAAIFLIALAPAADVAMSGNPIQRAVGRAMLFAIFWVPLFFLIENSTKWIGLAVMICLVLLGDLVPPLFNRKSGLKYLDRLSAAEEEVRQNQSSTYRNSKELVGRLVLTPVSFFFFVSFLVILLGSGLAKIQSSYWVLAQEPNAVLVAQYGELALFKRVDLATKEITGELLIIKFSDSTSLKLNQIDIGQLKRPQRKNE